MNDPDVEVSAAGDLHPIRLPAEIGDPVPLYEGPAILRTSDAEVDCDATVTLRWLPTPDVKGEVVHHDPRGFAFGEDDEGVLELTAPSPFEPYTPVADRTGPSKFQSSSTHDFNRKLTGVDGPVPAVCVYVINGDPAIGPKSRQFTIALPAWSLTLTPLPGASERRSHLKETGGYAPTHVLRVERADRSAFTFDEYQEVESLFWHAMSFVCGRLIGLALLVGLSDEDVPVWTRWQMTTVDRARFGLSWCDEHHFESQFSEFIAGLASRWSDPFWRDVLIRAIRTAIAANRALEVDLQIPAAQIGLELLAWVVLEEEGWLERDACLDAAGRIRLLLKWAGIPTDLPAQYPALAAQSAAYGNSKFDGPQTLTRVRGELVHPPSKRREWPSADVKHDAWRLSTWYLDLVLLRIANYQGNYADRRIEGRWVGTVEAVPWAQGRDESPDESG